MSRNDSKQWTGKGDKIQFDTGTVTLGSDCTAAVTAVAASALQMATTFSADGTLKITDPAGAINAGTVASYTVMGF